MINRRHALKTIAGATVVGSLSGCTQLVTQDIVEFSGTPAILEMERGVEFGDTMVGMGVGVEGRNTIQKFGVTREIRALNWGLLYRDFPSAGESLPATFATFTSPSIQIAGQELNPIAETTLKEMGVEFLSLLPTPTESNTDTRQRILSVQTVDNLEFISVEDATGRKVLRAFREATGNEDLVTFGDRNADNIEINTTVGPGEGGGDRPGGKTVPEWEGDTYLVAASWETASGDAGEHTAVLRTDKHQGDFVVVFGATPLSLTLPGTTNVAAGSNLTAIIVNLAAGSNMTAQGITNVAAGSNLTVQSRVERDGRTGIVHPPESDFTQPQLERHLREVNSRDQ